MAFQHLIALIGLIEVILGVVITARNECIFSYTVRIWSRWFPELLEFKSARSARIIWYSEFEGRMNRWLIRSGAAMVFVVIPLTAIVTAYWGDVRWTFVLIPLWLPLTTFLMLATNRRAIRDRLRRALRFEGTRLCEACGYRLEGNESGICPECGAAAEVAA